MNFYRYHIKKSIFRPYTDSRLYVVHSAREEGQLRYVPHTDPIPDSSLYLVHSAREEGQLRYVPHSLPVVNEFQILAYI